MESWRDSASEQVDRDFHTLINQAMPWATRSRSRYRHLVPFGCSIGIDDSTHFDPPSSGESTVELLDSLHAAARTQRYILRAVAFVVDARLPDDGSDALIMHLEHAEGTTLEVVTPYRRNLLLRRIRLGTMLTQAAAPIVWSHSTAT